jgi:bifunctional non-homologous end joining protein LigD
VRVFDCVSVGGEVIAEQATYTERMEAAAAAIASIPWAALAETLPVAEAAALWASRVEPGDAEGVVLRRAADTYSKATIGRVKRQMTHDYVVLGVEPGKGKLAGLAGALVLGLYGGHGIPEEVCRCGGGFSDAERAAMAASPERYIGRVAEVRGYELFASGALRHPTFSRWRQDKQPRECVMA